MVRNITTSKYQSVSLCLLIDFWFVLFNFSHEHYGESFLYPGNPWYSSQVGRIPALVGYSREWPPQNVAKIPLQHTRQEILKRIHYQRNELPGRVKEVFFYLFSPSSEFSNSCCVYVVFRTWCNLTLNCPLEFQPWIIFRSKFLSKKPHSKSLKGNSLNNHHQLGQFLIVLNLRNSNLTSTYMNLGSNAHQDTYRLCHNCNFN